MEAVPKRPTTDRAHVALIVETSLISGREILRGIAHYVRRHGPWAVFHEPRSLEASVPAWLKKWNGQGIIARVQTPEIAQAVLQTGLPVVDVLGVVEDTGIPVVHVNNTSIGQLAAEHLLDRGFRQFAYCGYRSMNWARQRFEAFSTRVGAEGFECPFHEIALHARSDASWEKQQERLALWIAQLPKPIGIMACYDPVGQRVLEAARRAGVTVPDDVAVIGVDDDETVCEVCDPPLSSIVTNHAQVGFKAAELLDRLMQGGRKPTSPLFIEPARVATRLSTDTLAIGDEDVVAALRFIRENACDGANVEDVVMHVAVSHSTLQQRFRHWLGRSIHDQIVHERIHRAKQLLAETNMPLVKIAQVLGFRHQEYMGVVFKSKVGMTPGAYRKAAQH